MNPKTFLNLAAALAAAFYSVIAAVILLNPDHRSAAVSPILGASVPAIVLWLGFYVVTAALIRGLLLRYNGREISAILQTYEFPERVEVEHRQPGIESVKVEED